MTWNRSDLLYFELAGEQDLTDLGKLQVPEGIAWLVATRPHLIRPWVAYKFPTRPLCIPFRVKNRQNWYETSQICLILNFRGNKILLALAGCRCQVPPVWVVATCSHLIGPWFENIFPLWCENWLKMAWNGFHSLNFELPEEHDLAYLGRFQVPGARCHLLGWQPLSHTWVDLGLWKTPPPGPSGPFCRVKIGNNHFSSPRTHF